MTEAAELPRGDDHARLCLGEEVTICCGAFATVSEVDGQLSCKACWSSVGWGRTSAEITVKPKKPPKTELPEWAKTALERTSKK